MSGDERRLKVLYVPENVVASLVLNGEPGVGDYVRRVVFSPGSLPDGVVCRSVYYDFRVAAFAMVLQSPTWPEVPAGNHLEQVTPDFRLIRINDESQVLVERSSDSWRNLPALF